VTITIAAAAAAVVVGLGFALNSLGSGPSASSSDSGPVVSGQTPGYTGTGSMETYTRFTLPDRTGVALSDLPPRPRRLGGDAVFRHSKGLTAGRGSTLALLGAGDDGTRVACAAGQSAHPLDSVPSDELTAGLRVCVQAHDGDTGLLTVRAVRADRLTVDITVWRS
jgi:hypothetical protein